MRQSRRGKEAQKEGFVTLYQLDSGTYRLMYRANGKCMAMYEESERNRQPISGHHFAATPMKSRGFTIHRGEWLANRHALRCIALGLLSNDSRVRLAMR
jgi:hypothetical protein